ncbi:Fc.00g038310.m01.CDS01 [Cosmosporella sp. VM-42]
MDEFLAVVGVQALRYAIRSGIALTSTYALGQCSRLLKSVEDKEILTELKSLRKLLDNKIKIISPAIDLVEFKSGRGNVFLESAAPLARSLHQAIVSLGRRIETVAAIEEDLQSNPKSRVAAKERRNGLQGIIENIKELLDRIDREIPLLQLAITASGESLSTSIPTGISPSRLLQASTFLIIGDTQFAQDPSRPVQIGPAFTLSLYMLFLGHASTTHPPRNALKSGDTIDLNASSQPHGTNGVYGLGEGDRQPLWQEVLHKARVRLCRARRNYVFDGMTGYQASVERLDSSSRISCPSMPFGSGDEYAYHLEIIEDLDDGRVHDDDKDRRPYDDIIRAGIRESIPIHQVSKIFYTDTGRILNIGNAEDGENNPVLLLKRDINARPTDKMEETVEKYLDDVEDGDGYGISKLNEDEEVDEQDDIDKQIRRESTDLQPRSNGKWYPEAQTKWKFPSHLDPEWIALEVFEEDDDEGLEPDDDESVGSHDGEEHHGNDARPSLGHARGRSSLDSRVVDQIKRLSIRPSTTPSTPPRSSLLSQDLATDAAETQDFVARSPFGTITTSLSLMEMLIRLTSLQEFQQASHLSIPDHILTFFLEETSTTGLVGKTQWRARSEAKRRMGFDPYTDTPGK